MKKHHHWLALGFALAIVASVQAQSAGSQQQRLQENDPSSACASARLSAWFDQQRQITDGAVDPHAPIATPAEFASGGQQAASEAAHPTTAQSHIMPAPRHKGPRG